MRARERLACDGTPWIDLKLEAVASEYDRQQWLLLSRASPLLDALIHGRTNEVRQWTGSWQPEDHGGYSPAFALCWAWVLVQRRTHRPVVLPCALDTTLDVAHMELLWPWVRRHQEAPVDPNHELDGLPLWSALLSLAQRQGAQHSQHAQLLLDVLEGGVPLVRAAHGSKPPLVQLLCGGPKGFAPVVGNPEWARAQGDYMQGLWHAFLRSGADPCDIPTLYRSRKTRQLTLNVRGFDSVGDTQTVIGGSVLHLLLARLMTPPGTIEPPVECSWPYRLLAESIQCGLPLTPTALVLDKGATTMTALTAEGYARRYARELGEGADAVLGLFAAHHLARELAEPKTNPKVKRPRL